MIITITLILIFAAIKCVDLYIKYMAVIYYCVEKNIEINQEELKQATKAVIKNSFYDLLKVKS